ncbi:MAG: LysR family transcriptional regulator [Bacteroidota bacterium]|nr:LysR family transcriptional regulator [Bacteroidota bacterium]
MATVKIKPEYKIWLSTETGEGIMGDGKWQILKAIEKTGSLMAATEALGLTYRRTWGDLKKIEEQLGFQLLDKSRGGKDGGTSTLTPEGKRLVEAFDHLHARVDGVIQLAFEDFIREITNDDPNTIEDTKP